MENSPEIKVESVKAITKTSVNVTLAEKPATDLTSADTASFAVLANGEAVAVSGVEKVASDLTGKTYKLTIASLNGKQGSLSVNAKEAVVAKGQEYAFDFKVPTATGVTVLDKNTIVVAFDEKLDSAAANTAVGNFTLKKLSDTTPTAVSNPVLSADGKTVTLTVASDLTVADYVLSLGNTTGPVLVKDVKGNGIILGTEVTFKPTAEQLADLTAPAFAKATYNTVTGEIKVSFNKTVTAVDPTKFSVNDVALTSNDSVTISGSEATIKLSEATKTAVNALTGELTLKSSKDAYANGDVKTAGESIKIVSEAPAQLTAATYNQETNKLTVTFDKPVTLETATTLSVDDADETSSKDVLKSAAVNAEGKAITDFKTASVTWTFDVPALETGLTTANLKAYIKAGAVKNEAGVLNSSGQETYAKGVKVTYTADETKPTLTGVDYNNNTEKLTLTFSEKVAPTPTVASIKFWSADGVALTNLANLTGEAAAETAASKTLTFDLAGKTTKIKDLVDAFNTGKTVKVTLDANTITDEATLQNVATKYADGVAVVYKDYVAPNTVKSGSPLTAVTVENQNLVTIKFNEPLDSTTAQNVANYVIKNSKGEQLTVTKATLQAVNTTDGTQVVSLTTATQEAGAPYTVAIKDVKDKAGNPITTAITDAFNGSAKVAVETLTVDNLAVTAPINAKNDTLTVTFNTAPDADAATNVANYAVLEATTNDEAGWAAAKAVSLTNAKAELVSGNANQVKITLDAYNLQNDKFYKVVASNVTTVTGKALGTASGDNDAVSTKTSFAAPTVDSVTQSNGTTGAVKLVFKEELVKSEAEVAANYKVGTQTPTKATYTWDATKKEATVVLDLATAITAPTNVVLTTAGTPPVTKLTNLAGVPFGSTTITAPAALTDLAKPIVASVAGTTVSGLDNDTITVKFNELVRPADATNAANYTITLADGTVLKASDLKAAADGSAGINDGTPHITYDGAGTVTIKLDNSGTGNDKKKYNLQNGTQVSVAVANVRDLAGNVVDTVTKSATVAGETTKPDFTGANATLTGTYTMTVVFDEEVDASTITKEDFKVTDDSTPANTITISSVELGTDLKTVTLTSASPLDASKVYTVDGSTTASIKDLAGNEQTAFTAKATQAVTVGAPTAAAVKVLTGTNAADVINAGNKAATVVTVTPSAATGSLTVTLTDTDGKSVTKTVAKTTTATTAIDVELDASTLKDGVITVKAVQTDAGGFNSTVYTGTAAAKDVVAPTSTITSAVYTASTDTLVITGTNFDTLLSTGQNETTDIKASLDWSKFVWDINGDGATTADATFADTDIASAKATSATTLTIVLTSDKGTKLEGKPGYGPSSGVGLDTAADTIDVTAGFLKDLAGNAATTDAKADAALTIN